MYFPAEQLPQPALHSVQAEKQNALIECGDLEGAQKILQRWLRDNPGSPKTCVATLELARLLFWSGNLEAARECVLSALEPNPDQTWALSCLAQIETRFGRYERARELFERARELEPGNHEALLFLAGDPIDQSLTVRRNLTTQRLARRTALNVAQLCSAIDFKRDRFAELATGPLTQASLDRANLMLDYAGVGEPVDVEVSLARHFEAAQRIVIYSSHAFGDSILGLAVLMALRTYYAIYPERCRPVELVTPFAEVFTGLAEDDEHLTVTRLCEARDPDEARIYTEDLCARSEKLCVLTNSDHEVCAALIKAGHRQANVLTVIDAHVDRLCSGILPWQTLVAPYRHVQTYASRLMRFMEIVLGHKVIVDPTSVHVRLPWSRALERQARVLHRSYGLEPSHYHCVIESTSKRAKMFSHDHLREILARMVDLSTNGHRRRPARRDRIVFCQDPLMDDTFASEISNLPKEVASNITVVLEDLPGMAALLAHACSVVSTDTGLAHLASALGTPTLILHTLANPYLWHCGGPHINFLASEQAMAAHTNLTSVSMIDWEREQPIMEEAFTVDEIVDAWGRLEANGRRPDKPEEKPDKQAGKQAQQRAERQAERRAKRQAERQAAKKQAQKPAEKQQAQKPDAPNRPDDQDRQDRQDEPIRPKRRAARRKKQSEAAA